MASCSIVIFASILYFSVQLTTAQTGSNESTIQGFTTELSSDTTSMATVFSKDTDYVTTPMAETLNCNSSASSQCLNGGECLANGSCACEIWYSGERCENMTDCPPGSCSHLGADDCSVIMSTPVCHCLSNYTGPRCEHENICVTRKPCKNNGTCSIDQHGNYSCTCLTGDPTRNCALNELDACTLHPPDSEEKYIACIDLIVGMEMLCSPGYTGTGCKQLRDTAEYCAEKNCIQNTGFCKPLCNRAECNGTKACDFAQFNSEYYKNVTDNCRTYFADGYKHDCYTEANLFDGFDGIRSKLKDCSPFFDTVCTRNISDGICNPHCNNEECLWDGMDCMNKNLQTLDGSIIVELDRPLSPTTYRKLSLVLRSGLYYQEFYEIGTRPKLQLKVVKPAELVQPSVNNTVGNISSFGNFSSVEYAGLFLASFLAKLPLDQLDVRDVYACKHAYYGNKCTQSCSSYCTKEGDICDIMSGQCLHGCRTGWWGDRCLDPCPRGCLGGCDRASGTCSSCVDGYYGAKNCSNDCDPYCRHVACNAITGECDCGEWRYFSFENSACMNCGEGCKSACDQGGNCACKSGYFGTRCDGVCSPNCDTQTCSDVDGRCSSCKAGFHGDQCEKPCGEGCSECHQDTGACGGKCKDGFVGENCQRSTAQPVTDNTGVIVAVVIAIIIVLVIVIIVVCYFKHRQSGDYIIKDEEDIEPVPKATSLEVKAHYGMQPTQTGTESPFAGQSSEMINMDDSPGGVYAGPAVTVTFSKEEDAVVFDGGNDHVTATEENTEQQRDTQQDDSHKDQEDIENQSPEATMEEDNMKAFANKGAMSAETMDNDVEPEEEDHEKNANMTGVRAPLASEEDLTAPGVPREDNNATDNSLDELEHAAIDALEHLDNDTGSKRSSSTSQSSKHSRGSSASSNSSKGNKDDEEHTMLTEM